MNKTTYDKSMRNGPVFSLLQSGEANLFSPFFKIFRHLFSRHEVDGSGIDAEPKSGRAWAVVKEMPHVGAAYAAIDFCSNHSAGSVRVQFDQDFINHLPITGPSGSAVKFRLGVEERWAAADTGVNTIIMMVPVDSTESRLRTLLSGDIILPLGQFLPPEAIRAWKPGKRRRFWGWFRFFLRQTCFGFFRNNSYLYLNLLQWLIISQTIKSNGWDCNRTDQKIQNQIMPGHFSHS